MVRRWMACGSVGLLIFAGVVVAARAKDPGSLEETRVVKFDPSFEKSLWGVQDSQKWRISLTLHVNPASKVADDNGPGTADRPLKTVARAVELAKPGTRVLIYPGVYGESITLQKTEALDQSGTADAPIVFEATEPGKVTLTGADVWRDWRSEGAGVYSASWPYKWGFNVEGYKRVGPLGLRSEMVFFDDQLMRQALNRKDLGPDSYCVDEAGGRLYIKPKDGVQPQEHKVEVTVRGAGLNVGDMWNVALFPSYVVVRGIAFNRFMHHRFLGRHVLLEDCRFEWNNEGLAIGGEDFVIRRVVALHNGGCTFVAPPRGGVPGMPMEIKNQHMNGLLEDNTAAYGNWRLFGYGGLEEWATAGIKVHTLTNLIIRRNRVQNNQAPGIWTDTKCNNVLVEGSVITDNMLSGLWIEICNGETVLRNNVVARNGKGINISNACHLTIQGNTIYGNKTDQIGEWHRGAARGGFRTVNLKIIDNRIVASDPQQVLVELPGFDYIPETGTFSKNVYYHPNKAVFGVGRQRMSFDQWQKRMRDTGSIFADPMFRDPESLDFTPKPGSPLLRG
jgi:hypothetical protein